MRILNASLFFLLLLLIWQFLVWAEIWSSVLIPSPLQVGRYLISAIEDGTLLSASYVTIKRLVQGYAVGMLVGVPLGLLNARFQLFEDTIGVLALGLQTLPSVCWAPLAILWFGQTEKAMFFIVVMGSIWSIALATDSGVRNVSPVYIRAARTLGSRGFHTWFQVIVPAALPFIISGMKQGWAFAWRSLMAAEIYITILTGFGLGNLLHYGRELHAMDAVIGVMFVIIAVGLLVDKVVFSPLEHFMHEKWGTQRSIR
ncbi:ABC-type transporter, permease subunit [Candidatus Protochlamydia naegleriophila]|uniref:ABC-type transporter, permease subunit n=1 Tax=Candidatus Protochlamydia naegleriophila TaxID=389348 RepID=A0A0U5JIY3_9BACT|nr:ABC transporter permease [Candidatus Protochlamydia naegleriophila]CUI17941.1 ABC-type transporter, permease subunit [Candidatus Protochlamydia naegleriophila]